jgi:hypothetical protein
MVLPIQNVGFLVFNTILSLPAHLSGELPNLIRRCPFLGSVRSTLSCNTVQSVVPHSISTSGAGRQGFYSPSLRVLFRL